MPYISAARRGELEHFPRHRPETAGELNFVITEEVLAFIKSKGLNYQVLVEVEGVLGHVAKELYRRVATPYEESAILRNGDIDGFKNLERTKP